MAIRLEFISLIIPIKNINAYYPGGFRKFCLDNQGLLGGRLWHDEHLLHDGAMNPRDMEALVNHWKEIGFTPFAEINGKNHWKDLCVIEELANYPTLPCMWLVVDPSTHAGYHKDYPMGAVVGRDEMSK